MKEEVKQTFFRLEKSKRREASKMYFNIDGGVHVYSPCFESKRTSCGPLHPRHKGDNKLCFEIKNATDFNKIGQLPVFDIDMNYADKIGLGKKEHIGRVFYHYYNESYLSISDMLEIIDIHGIFHVNFSFDRGIL